MKILFVDDDFDAAVVVRILRSRFPAHVIKHVTCLKDAREAIWRERFDIIFLDIMLPADEAEVPGSSTDSGLVGGLRLRDLVQKDAAGVNYKTRIVYITGLNMNENEELAAFGASDRENILTKPVLPATLEKYLK